MQDPKLLNITGSVIKDGTIHSLEIHADEKYPQLKSTTNAGEETLTRISHFNHYAFTSDDESQMAIGNESLYKITDGALSSALALGYKAGYSSTDPNGLIAIGDFAGYGLGGGTSFNTIIGQYALAGDTENPSLEINSSNNIAIGHSAGINVADGNTGENTIIGSAANVSLTTGGKNTTLGRYAAAFSTTGNYNIAIGTNAAWGITTGSNNTIIGHKGQGGGFDNTLIIGRGVTTIDVRSDANGIALGGVTAKVVDGVTVNNFVIDNGANLDFADDAAAATGGVPINGIYHTGGSVKIRIA